MMKFRIFAFLLFAFAASAFGSIARDGSGSGTTTLTFSGTNTNSLKIIFAFRTASTTAPTLPAGWTSIATGATASGGTTAAFRVGCNYSSSAADTTSGTWTGAANVVGVSYSGVSIGTTATCNTVGIGNNATSNAKTSVTASYPGVTVQNSKNWVVGFLGDSVPSLCTPTNLTNVTSLGDNAVGDTNAAVSTFTTSTCSVSSGTWMTDVLEIQAPSLRIQGNACEATAATCTIVLSGVVAGDIIAAGGTDLAGTTGVTITDNCGGSYTVAQSTTTTNSVTLAYSTSSSGACTVTIHGGGTTAVSGAATEIGPSVAFDCSNATFNTSAASAVTVTCAATGADYVWGYAGPGDGPGGTNTPTAPMVKRDNNVVFPVSDGDTTLAAAGTATSKWSFSVTTNTQFNVGLMAFKPVIPGGTVRHRAWIRN